MYNGTHLRSHIVLCHPKTVDVAYSTFVYFKLGTQRPLCSVHGLAFQIAM